MPDKRPKWHCCLRRHRRRQFSENTPGTVRIRPAGWALDPSCRAGGIDSVQALAWPPAQVGASNFTRREPATGSFGSFCTGPSARAQRLAQHDASHKMNLPPFRRLGLGSGQWQKRALLCPWHNRPSGHRGFARIIVHRRRIARALPATAGKSQISKIFIDYLRMIVLSTVPFGTRPAGPPVLGRLPCVFRSRVIGLPLSTTSASSIPWVAAARRPASGFCRTRS